MLNLFSYTQKMFALIDFDKKSKFHIKSINLKYENFITNWNRYENIKNCHREIKFNKSMSSNSSFIIEMRRCFGRTWNVKWEFKLKSTWSRWIKFEWRTTEFWSSFIKFTNIILSLLLFSVFSLGFLNLFCL